MERVVARIGRAHGLRGEVSIEVRTDVPELRFVPGAVFATDPAEAGPLTLRTVHDHGGTVLLSFEEVEGREAAEALRGTLLAVDAGASDEDDAWYEDELVGLRVEDPAGQLLGELVRLDTGGAQDLLVVRPAAGGEHVLVPFVSALVPVVDVPGGRVVVDPPGELFPVRVDVVTIFPEYLDALQVSLIGRAREQRLLDVVVHDLRDFTHDRHRTVDDTPYGGGAGMVMRPQPWGEALDHVLAVGRAGPPAEHAAGPGPRLLVPSPSGVRFTQAMAHELATEPWLVFACGRYEGIDERVLEDAGERFRVTPVSLGDYVLNGGEVAVLAVVEAVGRLLPGVVGNAESLVEESHEGGLLEYPVYTKPAEWRGRTVPEVLLSGHHGRVRRWRRDQRLARTLQRRPDLLDALDPAELDEADAAELRRLRESADAAAGQARFPEPDAPVAD